MRDNHTFVPLVGESVMEIAEHALELETLYPYGVVCAPTLMRGEATLRQVSNYVHSRGPKHRQKFVGEMSDWVKLIEADPDIKRLMTKTPSKG